MHYQLFINYLKKQQQQKQTSITGQYTIQV